ncbi:TPM domain-containing protein [Bacteroidota bacterium]
MNYPMKYLSGNKQASLSRSVLLALLISFAGSVTGAVQNDLPVPNQPSDWVNDYANVFNANEKQQLSRKLNQFEYNNSTQIFVVTINENDGYPASMLAPMIGEAWGVGKEGKDNGLLVLMDMKERDVFISTGYGLEEFIPDAIAKRIVENEIIPAFKQGDFYGGIDAGTNVMIDLLEGKFTPDEYNAQLDSSGSVFRILPLLFLFILFFGMSRSRRAYGVRGGRRSSLPFWLAMGMMSGSRNSGSFGHFSSGSGGFGGFGGGGGGSFGGGGAGGSW